MDIRSTNFKEHRLLTLKSCHLNLLLKLLQSEIDTKSYLEEYELLFSNEEQYNYPNIYSNQLLFLEEHQSATICTDNEVRYFIDILQICNNNIKAHLNNKNFKAIRDEADYNHNVPSLIVTKNVGAIENYLSCRSYCSKEMVQSYENTWEKITQQFYH